MPGQPNEMRRRRSDPVPWSALAARDRLSSTVFIAALLHGIIILGVTFGAIDPARDAGSSLEVVLVTAPPADRAPPPEAVLLAQTNLVGSGNAPADAALQTALAAPLAAPTPGPARPGADAAVRVGRAPAAERTPVLTARRAPDRRPEPGDPDRTAAQQVATAPPLQDQAAEFVGRVAATTVVPDANPRELLISANTRESRIAGYLTLWKRKVEQTGTLNYPTEARRAGTGYPVLEVAIAADGSLRAVTVLSSSGQRGLDQAAVQILKLAAPFAPFPDSLRADYDVLRFAYEWRFSAGVGRVQGAGA
jgi:protein TonB